MDSVPLYLQPGRIGSLEIPNRIARGATSETMASPSGVVYDAFVELYRRLGEGGAGLLLSGHLYVDPRGQASANQTGIHDDKVIPGLRQATEAVHEAGGRIFAQIGHCGSQTMMSRITPVAPSPVPNAMYTIQPEELSSDEVRDLVRAFGDAAGRAAEAGFDGIHIHGGNGYLISEFCSPHANTRDDEWGGDSERRSRFMVEVYEAVRAAVGADFPVTARLSVEDSVEGGLQREESLQRARVLADRGINGFETTYGVMRSYFENIRPYVAVGRAQAWRNLLVQRVRQPAGAEAYYRPFARAVKDATGLPIILVGGVRTTQMMTDILDSGDADFLAMARPFIREPDLVRKLEAGRTGGVECVSCNMCLAHDGFDPLQCWRDNPRNVAVHIRKHYWTNRRKGQ
ncbi:MAG: NADH:flavin oxidoreductase [Acidimicrobiia bacterium]|nr:NADH:flavin oxidoreductase [Acidimicrobiia bacterium]